MKPRSFLLAALSGFAVQQAGAVVLIGPTSFNNIATNTIANLGNVTAAQVAGYNQLVITYSVTLASGGGWLGFGVNSDTSNVVASMNGASTNLGALLRTTSGDNHQLYRNSTPSSIANAGFPAAGASVRLTIDITNGLTGTSAVTYAIDEGSGTFVNADKTLTGNMVWNPTGVANFTGASYNGVHNITNFTVQAIPEPSSAAFALASSTGLIFLRRRRA